MSKQSDLTSRIRRHPLSNYLLLLMLTVAAYWLYSSLIVPKIEVATALKRVQVDLDVPEYQDSLDHHRWFKHGDWELNPFPSCTLHTARFCFRTIKSRTLKPGLSLHFHSSWNAIMSWTQLAVHFPHWFSGAHRAQDCSSVDRS